MPSQIQRKDGLPRTQGVSHAVMLVRIDEVCSYICAFRPRRCTLMKWIRDTYGLTTAGAVKLYTRVLEEFRRDCQEDISVMRAKLAGFCDSVIADTTASHRDKVRAAHLYKELFGLAAPQQLQVSANMTSTCQSLASIPWDDVARVQSQLAGVKVVESLPAIDVTALIDDQAADRRPEAGETSLQPADSSLKP